MDVIQLSLCMIVENAEKQLLDCLQSLRNHVDEIIIVDTGSTDGTKEIAKQLGAAVYEHDWQESFSEARNAAIEKASGKWILFLDADELITEEEVNKLKSSLNHPLVEGYLLYIQTFTNGYGLPITQALRLFRNREEYRYKNRVFERIPEEIIANVDELDITIKHYPDSPSMLNRQQKFKLLALDLQENKDDCYLHYVYGIELFNERKLPEALNAFKHALALISHSYMYAPDIYKYLAMLLFELTEYQETVQTTSEGIYHFPYFTDLTFLRGKAYKEIGDYEKALKDFQTCLQYGSPNKSFVTEPGVGSYQAYYNLGEVHEYLLNREQAIECYIKAYTIDKSYTEPLYKLAKLFKEHNQGGKLDAYLIKWLALDKLADKLTLIDILSLAREYELALTYIAELKQENINSDELSFVKGICLMMLQKADEAEKYYSIFSEKHPLYSQVLIRRIQNQWIKGDYKQAEKLIADTPTYYQVYSKIHKTLESGTNLIFNEEELETVAKQIEHLIWLEKKQEAKALLLNLLQSKPGKELISVGVKLANNKEYEIVATILAALNDNHLIYQKLLEELAWNGLKRKEKDQTSDYVKRFTTKLWVKGYFVKNELLLSNLQELLNTWQATENQQQGMGMMNDEA